MIKLAILGLLHEQPLHGYELKKRLGEVLGPLSRVSFGSLYPALAKLEAEGEVEAVDDDGAASFDPIPMTGSLAGEAAAFRSRRRGSTGRGRRGKKVYRITDAGRAAFAEQLASPADADDDRSFSLRLAFGRHLAPEARLRLLERRRALLVERLEAARATASGRQLDTWARSLVEHDTETTERDISWIDRLIARERPAATSAAAPRPATDHPAGDVDPVDPAAATPTGGTR